jgi:polysaccharide biosynthesis/export protein
MPLTHKDQYMKFHRFLVVFCITAALFSCKPQQKVTNYLQNVNVNDTSGKKEVNVPDLVIQKGDQLSIQIYSLSLKPEKSDAPFNQLGTGATGEGTAAGYLVDNEGNIEHHRLGTIHVEGLTKTQLAAEIKKRLTVPVELVTSPTVVIRITNFKVTMLGQVSQQGTIKIPGEKVTVLEAIGLAGGVTDFGKKTNIKILRELNGKRETGFIDLTSKDIFESPYYYLAQNDILIIEESNTKMKETEQARTMQKISFAFTLVTVAATIVTIFTR